MQPGQRGFRQQKAPTKKQIEDYNTKKIQKQQTANNTTFEVIDKITKALKDLNKDDDVNSYLENIIYEAVKDKNVEQIGNMIKTHKDFNDLKMKYKQKFNFDLDLIWM